MSDIEAVVREVLAATPDPHNDAPLSTWLKHAGGEGDHVAAELELGYPFERRRAALGGVVRRALESDPRVAAATVDLHSRIVAHKVQKDLAPLTQVRNIVPVASGKGGVGKSTVSANLALALQQEGARVGVLDADIYGPSQPRMFGLEGKPEVSAERKIVPPVNHDIPVISMGFLLEGEDTPTIWRGPMVSQALQQLLSETAWPELDYLIVDLPPGTGDIQLTLLQKVPVSGAVVVTTPQDIALADARKALRMFEKLEVPVLGVVENMSTHVCSACGHEDPVFGSGGGERMASEYGVGWLGRLPLDRVICEQTDSGRPTVVAEPDSDLAQRYRDVAVRVAARLALQPVNQAVPDLNLSVSA